MKDEAPKPSRWASEWWWDVTVLMQRVEALYAKAVAAGKPLMEDKAAAVLIDIRKWRPVRNSIKRNLPKALRALKAFYAPEGWGPGPAFVFPEFDVDGVPRQAQSKPLNDRFGKAKYFRIGDKEAPIGPIWVGNDRNTLELIVKTGSVVLTEGPMDLVAVRAVNPNIPSMTSLTKKLGKKHLAYLSLLGVTKAYLLFDNEGSAVGDIAMDITAQSLKKLDIRVVILECPAKDPSAALESSLTYGRLKSLLDSVEDQIIPRDSDEDDDSLTEMDVI